MRINYMKTEKRNKLLVQKIVTSKKVSAKNTANQHNFSIPIEMVGNKWYNL